MLKNRKIVTVKTLQEQFGIFVKAKTKKLYGRRIRPSVVLFQKNLPRKATSSSAVGLSGLCCHILALLLLLSLLLLFVKRYTDSDRRVIELT